MASQLPPSTAPWAPDSRETALSALRAAYPKATYPWITSEMAYAMCRAMGNLVPGTVPFVDNEFDNLAYVRMNWINH